MIVASSDPKIDVSMVQPLSNTAAAATAMMTFFIVVLLIGIDWYDIIRLQAGQADDLPHQNSRRNVCSMCDVMLIQLRRYGWPERGQSPAGSLGAYDECVACGPTIAGHACEH